MKYVTRRTEGIRWDRWRRIAMIQSLRMMVLSGVVRRAELYPHRHFDKCVDLDADPEATLSSMSDVVLDEQSWLTRFSCRRADSLLTHARHTT
jgi:hypothetical protein